MGNLALIFPFQAIQNYQPGLTLLTILAFNNLQRCKRELELFKRFVTYLDGLSRKHAA